MHIGTCRSACRLMLWTCMSLKGSLPCTSQGLEKRLSRFPPSIWAITVHINVYDPCFIAVPGLIVLITSASFLTIDNMLWRILAWLCFASLLLLVHTVPAILTFYGISPYTGMTFNCLRPHCRQVPESIPTISSTIVGALLTIIIWIIVWYGLLNGIVSGMERCIRRRPRRYITPTF